MRLRRSALSNPGIARKRRGNGFANFRPDGDLLADEDTPVRIKDLVIPPAWKKVWICPYPKGHIQAVDTDAAGRRQYLYHQAWQDERAEEKFDRVLELSKELPGWRARSAEDRAGRGLTRDRVLALALHLLDRRYFRAGGEPYAEEHQSYGLATLLCEHVTVRRGAVRVRLSRQERGAAQPEDRGRRGGPRGAGLLRRDGRAERLLVCRTVSGWVDVRAEDLNTLLKELVGDGYCLKGSAYLARGTVLAAEAFADTAPAASQRVAKRVSAAVMKEVAEALGNTPAVARGSYVDPRVVTGYEHGQTILAGVRRAARVRPPGSAQEILEKATRVLIRRVTKNDSASGQQLAKTA